ncbi:MAG: leucine-rich repeat domain-containing protein, partial [Fibrobacteria bacterium]|nr:leucine-rich repeat domain-containing protein [Fibrobacteria bacterium]
MWTLSQQDSLAVRFILDTNGMQTRQVEDFVKWEGGRVSVLDLSNTQLEVIPDTIKTLQSLRELRLSATSLTQISDSICNLGELAKLYIDQNQLEVLPDSLHRLKKLLELDVHQNKLEVIPDSLGSLINLKRLNLGKNKIKNLPANIGRLINLTYFNIGNNQISALPDSIGNLSLLDTLNIFHNYFRTIPASLSGLTRLTFLEAAHNEFSKAIPEPILSLTSLKFLSLSHNRIVQVPIEISSLVNLEILYLDNNNISTVFTLDSLVNLRALHLQGNNIGRIPTNVSSLKSLSELFLNENSLRELPYSLGQISSLKYLNVYANNMQVIPEQITSLNSITYLIAGGNNQLCAVSEQQANDYALFGGDSISLCPLDSFGFLQSTGAANNVIWARVLIRTQADTAKAAATFRLVNARLVVYNIKGEIVSETYSNDEGVLQVALKRGAYHGGITLPDSGSFTYRSFNLGHFTLANTNADTLYMGEFLFTDNGPREGQDSVMAAGEVLHIFSLDDTLYYELVQRVDFPLDTIEARYILDNYCGTTGQEIKFSELNSIWTAEWGDQIPFIDRKLKVMSQESEYSATIPLNGTTIKCTQTLSPKDDGRDND